MLLLMLITGCDSKNNQKILNVFKDKVLTSDSYKLTGSMEIISNEENYTYNIDISYQKNQYYKVILHNQIKNHQQVLLKNDDGVYVVTPEINKSFKFQSEWPMNSSQAYLLDSIVNDIKNDQNYLIERNKDNIIVSSKVNYPNNSSLISQKTTINNKGKAVSNIVLDKDGNEVIKVKFSDISYNVKFDEDYFSIDSILDDNCCDIESQTSIIDSIIYPLYIPVNTFLNSKDVINDDSGERVILTFSGSKPFMLVEEKINITNNIETTPIHGEPVLFKDGFGALTDSSLSWTNNNIEYYLTGDTLTGEELVNIAESLNYEITSTMQEK